MAQKGGEGMWGASVYKNESGEGARVKPRSEGEECLLLLGGPEP